MTEYGVNVQNYFMIAELLHKTHERKSYRWIGSKHEYIGAPVALGNFKSFCY